MLPSEKFAKVMRITRLCAAACGADIVDLNYKLNLITYMVVFCIVFYFIFSVYTIQLKFSENWTIVLESFCMVGSVLQGISKLVSGIIYSKDFRYQCLFLESVYEEYEIKGQHYTIVLNKCISRVRAVLQCVACVYAGVVILLISLPLIFWTFTGNRLFVMQFYMPRLDTDTTLGYLGTCGVQSICLLFGAFGNFAGDIFMLMFFAHSTLLVDIFELKIHELNKMVAKNPESPKAFEKMKEVIAWHQTYSDFVQRSDRMYFWTNFNQITTSGLSMVLTLVIMFTGNWPGAYAYILLSFGMMYMYCGMGTLVEIANEKVCDEIYAIHWYAMTVSQQKAVRFMLMESQSPKQITVGGVVPLSVSTGLQVTKTVYSVFMMFLNFFDQ